MMIIDCDYSGVTVFESTKTRPGDKRKREGPGDPGDIEGYKGPWAPFADESKSSKPSEVHIIYLLSEPCAMKCS